MATRGKITELYDIDGIKAQQDKVIGYVEQFIAETNKAKPIKIQLEGAEKTKEVIKGVTELGLATKEYEKIVNQAAVAQAKLDALQSDQGKKLAELKIQQQQVSAANKQAAQEALGQVDAYKKLEQEYNIAAKEAKNLAVQFGAQSSQAQEASKRALELDSRLKAADANVGRFNKNVGNYSGALKVLEQALQDVKKKMDDASKSGNNNSDVVEQLRKEEALLSQLLSNQATGFATATAEIKTNTKALQQMEAAGLKGTKAYQELFAATADLKDETSDLKKALTNAAPDDVAFNAAADAARGLVGVYGLAKSGAAALGIENEELQETMVKLQAAETALQSIEAIRAVFKKENAVAQALSIALGKIEIVQTNLQTAAQSKNIVVKYAAIAAQKALNAAMAIGTGPLGIFLAIVSLLVISLSAFAAGNKSVTKTLKELNAELDFANKSLDLYLHALESFSSERIATLRAGFASEKQLRQQALKDQKQQLDAIIETENKEAIAYDKAMKIRKDAATGRKKISEEQLQNAIDISTKFEATNAKRLDAESKYRIALLDNQRAEIEEAAKLSQSELQIRIDTANTQASYLQSIASDETKSYQERIAALRAYLINQQQLINLQRQQQLADPTLQPEQRRVINSAADQKIIQNKRDINKQILDLDRSNAERIRKADLDILKIRLEDNIKANEAIIENENKSNSERLDAAYEAYQLRSAVINAQLQEDLKNLTLNDKEKEALAVKAASDIQAITIEYGTKQLELVKANEEKITAAIEQERLNRINSLQISQNEELINLNAAFKNGIIGLDEYNRQRQKIDKDQNIALLQQERDNSFQRYSAAKARYDLLLSLNGENNDKTKKANDELLAAEKELSDKRLALSQATTDKIAADEERLRDLKKQFLSEAYDTFKTIVEAQYDREKNAIQDQINLNEDKKNKDIEAVNATTASEQEKADKITVINLRAQAQKEALERRQRQIDVERARFEKATTIAQIIANTAAAIINQLKVTPLPAGFPFIAAIGAIGALQLAKAIATPIPKFKDGKGEYDDYEGWAITGDGGKSELHVRPDGSMERTPAVPTLTWVGKNDIIHPDADMALRDLQVASMAGMAAQLRTPVREQDYGKAMSVELSKGFERLNRTIAGKKELHIKPGFNSVMALHKYGSNWNRYVNEQINF